MICPEDNCGYESSEQGVKIHYGRSHEGTISGVIVECDWCGGSVRKHEYRLDRSENLFCGKECRAKYAEENWTGEDAGGWQGGSVEVECAICEEEIVRPQWQAEGYENNVCSMDCFSELMSGENSPRWKGGKVREPFYNQPDWRQCRERVVKRDGGACQSCGEEREIMNVHHIEPISSGGAKFDEDNLVTLCVPCHRQVHGNPEENAELIEVN